VATRGQDSGHGTNSGFAGNFDRLIFPAMVSVGLFLLLYAIYQQALGGYQTDDYSLAYSFVDRLLATAGSGVSLLSGLLTGALGGGKVHWTPVTNVILFFTLDDERLALILTVNLAVIVATATAIAMVARSMGAGRLPAALAAVWAGTSQALVFAATSVWGVMNLLAPLFGLLASYMLWRWTSAQCYETGQDKGIKTYYAWFLLFFLMALFTKETEIRCALVAGLSGFVLFACSKSLVRIRHVFSLFLAVAAVVLGYFALRYFFTDAQVPLLRTPEELAGTYHQPRMSPGFVVKNVAQLLLGSLTPVNSYHIYLSLKNGLSLQLLLQLLPALTLGLSLLVGYLWSFARSSNGERLVLVFCGIFLLASLFPEALLGKVSEIYAMATLWPLALTGAMVSGKISHNNRPMSVILTAAAVVLIATNVYQTKGKVAEYMVTSDYAHSMRLSMLSLTRDLPAGSRVGLIHMPRSPVAFGPFGEKGIHASGARPRVTEHRWVLFEKGEVTEAICSMDLVLEESADRSHVQIVDNYKNSFCRAGGKGVGSADL